MARYEVYLYGPEGGLTQTVTKVTNFRFVQAVNEIGTFDIGMPVDTPRSLFRTDSYLELYRGPNTGSTSYFGGGFIRRVRYRSDDSGFTTLTVSGVGPNDLLKRRIVAYAAGSVQAQMTDQADDLMKAIVKDNLGTDATAARDISAILTIRADAAQGPSITKGFSWRNVLKVLQDISKEADEQGTKVYFNTYRTDVLSFAFQTYIAQMGTDRTLSSGVLPLVFSYQRGNLGRADLDLDTRDEVNYVYAGGIGEGARRLTAEQSDATRIGLAPYNRREGFVDARNARSTAVLNSEAYVGLFEGRPANRFTAQIFDTPNSRYGRDWGFGDRVSIDYLGKTYEGLVNYVELTIGSDGKESLFGVVKVDDVTF